MEYQEIINQVYKDLGDKTGCGEVASYIPELGSVDPTLFGIALADVDGNLYEVGHTRTRFSIQSITKVFTLIMVYAKIGKAVWKRVNHEPSGNPFNSIMQLEYEHGIPRNPFINAGALVVTDLMVEHFGDIQQSLTDFLTSVSGTSDFSFNEKVARSEWEHGNRNLALAHFLKSYGNFKNSVPDIVKQYCTQCSLEMDLATLAQSLLFLANKGYSASAKANILTLRETKRVNAIMSTCGLYDEAGEFAYRVGLPAKSGVGGGIVATLPGKFSIAVYSPGLNPKGNSQLGKSAMELFTTYAGISMY